MNPRELVILLLGLAIVAVVLRGLYVALQARRGQIRLAIDKNIPKDVDLDALEMAELPSGGARVVRRGGNDGADDARQAASAAVMRANARAAELDLGEESNEAVPVLMDAVQVSAGKPSVQKDRILIDDYDSEYDDLDESDDSDESNVSSDEDTPLAATATESLFAEQEEEVLESQALDPAVRTAAFDSDMDSDDRLEDDSDPHPDAVLLDYEAEDMAAVAPDYDEPGAYQAGGDGDEEDEDEEDDFTDEEDYDDSDEDAEYADDDVYDEDDFEDSDEDDYAAEYDDDSAPDDEDYDDDLEEIEGDADYDDFDEEDDFTDEEDEFDDRSEPGLGSFDDDLDDFSMTAGERIGFEGKGSKEQAQKTTKKAARNTPARQSTLFESDDEDELHASASGGNKGGKRRSLLAALTGWGRTRKTEQAQSGPQESNKVRAEPKQDTSQAPATPAVEAAEAVKAVKAVKKDTVYRMEPQQLDIEPVANDPEEGLVTSTVLEDEKASLNNEPSEVLVLNVMAKEGYVFAGDDLMHTLITAGLKFGDMNIFHQRLANQAKGPVIFSVANVLNPGTFDLNTMDSFTTVGISLFLALPSPINNLDAFEKMLATAQQLCATLGGDLRDDTRNLMTAQTIEHYRQRVRDFELRQLKAAGSRG